MEITYKEKELKTRTTSNLIMFNCCKCGNEINIGDRYYGKRGYDAHIDCVI